MDGNWRQTSLPACQMDFRKFFFILKVVSSTFLLVSFLSLNESTCQTIKNIFYFTSKALLFLEKFKFQNLKFSDFKRHQIPKYKTRNISKSRLFLKNFRQPKALLTFPFSIIFLGPNSSTIQKSIFVQKVDQIMNNLQYITNQ